MQPKVLRNKPEMGKTLLPEAEYNNKKQQRNVMVTDWKKTTTDMAGTTANC